MRNSTLRVYQRFAKHIGEAKARLYLREPKYGNGNPSLERTPNGRPHWPRGGVVYHPLCGQRVLPVVAAQLKRWASEAPSSPLD